MKRKFVDWRGIRVKLFIRFLSLLAIILLLMWLLEFALYDSIYKNIVSKDLNQNSDKIVQLYDQGETEQLKALAEKKGYTIVVFSKLGNVVDVKFSNYQNIGEASFNNKLIAFANKINKNTSTRYYETEDEMEFFVCGQEKSIDGNDLYYYAYTCVTVLDQTNQVITFMLLIISLVSLVITLGVCLILSNDISKPIVNVSNKAKQLSSGKLDVKFDSGEYTEVSTLSDALNYSIGEIKKSEDIQKDVIQNVSHELRTPLTMIASYTELLLDFSGNDPKKREEHLGIIKEQTDKLQTLVNDMIDLSKLQSKTMTFEKEKFDLSDLVKHLEQNYKTRFEKEGFKFVFDIVENAEIVADPKRIEQVVINLLNNAINYSRETKEIEVKLFNNENGMLELDVCDKGIGIEQKDLNNIFKRHFRSTHAERATTGSGVGLSIVKEILDYHGYQICVESEFGKGSKFSIIFN